LLAIHYQGDNNKMKIRQMIIICTLILLTCTIAYGESCDISDSALRKMQPSVAMEFIKKRFKASDYTCAIHMTRMQSEQLVNFTGQKGVDARFALREMALELSQNKSYPSEKSLELLQAAASSLAGGATSWSKAERQADVQMIFNAGKQFKSQNDISGWLNALVIAIPLDRQLPDDARRVPVWELTGSLIPDSTQSYKYIDKIATLAEITRGDKVMEPFRSNLANMIYYSMGVREDEGNREEILARCKQMLRLTEAMSDVETCKGCVPGWHWQPILKVGIAYHKLGKAEEAKKYVDQAINIARNIQNPDYRLGQYRFVMSNLLMIRPYERDLMIALLDEMKKLANSLSTPVAKEVRETTIPRYMDILKIKE
jgi:tetratricopeptide (TPR) repeat protein